MIDDMNADKVFRFKKFTVSHSSSSMKVGVDGVLIGAWGNVVGEIGLDLGCGCGLLALMAAQRNPYCLIEAIDIHLPSVIQSSANFASSPWKSRLKVALTSASDLVSSPGSLNRYDFIISNPPFFNAGLKNISTPREIARHASSLSPQSVLNVSSELLKNGGTVSLIMPYSDIKLLKKPHLLHCERMCKVANLPGKIPKRIMLTFRKGISLEESLESLYIRDSSGNYSNDYKALTSDFYLNF